MSGCLRSDVDVLRGDRVDDLHVAGLRRLAARMLESVMIR